MGFATTILAGLLACGGPPPQTTPRPADTGGSPCAEPDLTWESFGAGFTWTWCTPCHSATLSGDDRRGAPDHVDLDTWDDLQDHLDPVRAWSTGDTPAMPPAGGVTESDRALWQAYLACGAPGTPTEAAPCDAPEPVPGDVTLRQSVDLASLCEGRLAVTIEGDLTVGGDLGAGCVCEVNGSLVLDGGPRAALGGLREVSGDVSATPSAALSEVALPDLHTIGGDLRLEGTPALASVDLSAVVSVGGELVIAGNDVLTGPGTDARLGTVGDGVLVRDNPALTSVGLTRAAHIGGDLILEDLPALTDLSSTVGVETVGGALHLNRLHGVVHADGFLDLREVAGDLSILDLDGMTLLDGFTDLDHVGGSVVVGEVPLLRRSEAFPTLVTVAGDLRVTDADALYDLDGMHNLASVGGSLILARLPALETFGFLDLHTVGTDLMVDQTGLAELRGFPALNTVSRDLGITDNPRLPQAQAQALADDIDVGGTATLSGNGG